MKKQTIVVLSAHFLLFSSWTFILKDRWLSFLSASAGDMHDLFAGKKLLKKT
ncbi:hypothetical protein GLW00_16285 [Halobacillus litoralis]|uniref:Uncharacterized protein n=1 Tax=Halobacillus litoralis TaxID=45668 RepID=A0A845FFL2_9BACI|nr:hypothetical protein [Halobacillus litoralis]MYL72406.1 hypothetical protein [Halobacillus litoralis]